MKTKLLLAVFALLGAFAFFGGRVEAATINVTAGATDYLNNGNCSLYEALESANNDTAIDNCIAGSGSDTINMPDGTYLLNTISLNLGNTDIILSGASRSGTIIDGDGSLGLGYSGGSVVHNLTIQHLTITNSVGLDGQGEVNTVIDDTIWSNNITTLYNGVVTIGGDNLIGNTNLTVSNTLMYDGYSDNSNDSGCGIKVEFKNQVNIFNVKFYDNNCEEGVIVVKDTLTLNIDQAEINSNSADYGLVVINNDVTNTHINELDIYDNTINLDSIMLIGSPNVDINHLDMYDNFAVGIMNIPNDGGTSSQTLLDIRLQNSSFVRNEATQNIVVIDSFLRHSGESGGMDVNIDNVTIADNSTSFFPPLMLSSNGQYTPTKGIDGVISNLTIANNNRSGDVGMDISAAMIFISFGSSPSGVALQNILLANNLDEGTPRNCSDIFDPPMFWPASTGNNLSDDDTCNNVFNHVNDLNDIDAGLNPLEEDNGTWVLPLQVNSPAIDGGVTVSGMTTDQRGMARPQNNAFDIGAYETVLGVDTSNSNQSGGNSEQGNNASNNSDSNMGNISGNLGETGTTILSTSLLLSVAMSTIVASKRLIKNTRAHYKR